MDEFDILLESLPEPIKKTGTPFDDIDQNEPYKSKRATWTRGNREDEVMVQFTNSKGEEIIGWATLYYVVKQDGKDHYKKASSCTILTDDLLL